MTEILTSNSSPLLSQTALQYIEDEIYLIQFLLCCLSLHKGFLLRAVSPQESSTYLKIQNGSSQAPLPTELLHWHTKARFQTAKVRRDICNTTGGERSSEHPPKRTGPLKQPLTAITIPTRSLCMKIPSQTHRSLLHFGRVKYHITY